MRFIFKARKPQYHQMTLSALQLAALRAFPSSPRQLEIHEHIKKRMAAGEKVWHPPEKKKPARIKKATRLPVGSIRRWTSGLFQKIDQHKWQRVRRARAAWRGELAVMQASGVSGRHLDQWVAERFRKAGKPVGHLLWLARELMRLSPRGEHQKDDVEHLCGTLIRAVYQNGPAGMPAGALRSIEQGIRGLLGIGPAEIAKAGRNGLPGERRKWKDGWYVKQPDGTWVKEKEPKRRAMATTGGLTGSKPRVTRTAGEPLERKTIERKTPVQTAMNQILPTPQPSTPIQPDASGFRASPFQQVIFDWVERGQGNGIVEAVAGSGKTTTLVKCLERIPGRAGKSVTFVAFNNKIKKELEARVPAGVTVKTFHGLGWSAWQRFFGRFTTDTNGDKVRNIIRNVIPEADAKNYGPPVKDLVMKAKDAGLAPSGIPGVQGIVPDIDEEWMRLIEHFGIDFTSDPDSIEKGIRYAKQVLRISIQDKGLIDFSDMQYMPIIYGAAFYQNDWLFVDEAQDASDIRREMAKRALKRGGRLVAVGDKNQAIYGFAGANPESLDLIREDFRATPMPLSICYRCPKSVIAMAQEIVPQIQAAPTAPEGKVEDLGRLDDPKPRFKIEQFQPADMIICRNNAPLVAFAYELLRNKIACKVEGRDIGKSFTSLIDRMKAKSIEELVVTLGKWRDQEVAKLKRKDPEANLDIVFDKFDTIMTFIETTQAKTVDALKQEIEKMFVDTETGQRKQIVTLSSVHRAKGLEAPRVFILNKHLMPSKYARKPWEKQQEENLRYVAYTRAMQELYFIESGDGPIKKARTAAAPDATPKKVTLEDLFKK